jgi:hypothetical protein
MSHLSLQKKIAILFSIAITLLLFVNITLQYIDFKNNLKSIEEMKAYNLLLAVKSAMEKTQYSQEDSNSIIINLRDMVKKVSNEKDLAKREQIVFNSLYYKSMPFQVALSVGQIAGAKDGYKVDFQMIDAFDKREEAKGFSKESILKANKSKEFFFEIDWSEERVQGFLAIETNKHHLRNFGTIEDDIDGNGYNSLGFKMRDWKLGGYYSGFFITKNIEESINNKIWEFLKAIFIQIVSATILIIFILFFIKKSVIHPIKEAIEMIQVGGSDMLQASTQISDASCSLAEGANKEASSVEEVTATLEESNSINFKNAENVKIANNLAKDSTLSAQNGYEKLEQLILSIQDINNSSSKISKIVKTIDEIAFQINLLSLNAAVEAARAGEHGLGFAVVAEEVKNLANRSANAARETSVIIDESIEQVRKSDEITKDTSKSFGDILEKTKNTALLIADITLSIEEQNEGMLQISKAMEGVDMVTQQTASSSEEVAAASEELNAQANSMNESIQTILRIIG